MPGQSIQSYITKICFEEYSSTWSAKNCIYNKLDLKLILLRILYKWMAIWNIDVGHNLQLDFFFFVFWKQKHAIQLIRKLASWYKASLAIGGTSYIQNKS